MPAAAASARGRTAGRRSGAGAGAQVTVTDSHHPALRVAPTASSRRQCPRDSCTCRGQSSWLPRGREWPEASCIGTLCAALLSFVKEDGKGFLGTHSATDTYYNWPEYGDLIGGYFNEHPWMQVHCVIRTEDKAFPATAHFPDRFPFYDEIYQFKAPYSRDKLRVLMSVDPDSVDLTNPRVHRTDRDFAVTWVHNYGKGRVFYSSLGHRDEVWDLPDIQKMWIEAVKWVTGMTAGDATPRPAH